MRRLKATCSFVFILSLLPVLFGAIPVGAMQEPAGRQTLWGSVSRRLTSAVTTHDSVASNPAIPARDCPSWKVVSSPNVGVGANELLSVAAADSRTIWATGYYTTHPGGSALPLSMRWNGQRWKTVPVPLPGRAAAGVLLGIAHIASSNQFWSVGYWRGTGTTFSTLIERWDGASWHVIPSPNGIMDSSLTSVTALSAHDAWAVGGSLDKHFAFHTLTEHWNGTRWQVVPSPGAGDLYGITAFTDGTAWAVGDSYNGNLSATALIERWDGTKWWIVVNANPPGATASDLYGIFGSTANTLWAVGDYQDVNSHVFTLAEQWNVNAWRVVATPNGSGDSASVLQGIVASGAKNAWAVGFDINAGGNQATLIEQWNGRGWNLVSSPNSSQPNNILQAVAAIPESSHVVSVGLAIDDNMNSVTLS